MGRTDRLSVWNEVFALVLLFAGTLLFFALISYTPKDIPSWFWFSHVSPANHPAQNFIGPLGAIVAGICFLLLVSLAIEALLKGFSHYIQSALPGGMVIALTVYLIFDFAVVVLLFAMIFKFLPDVEIQWRDVWIGAVLTAILFGIGKWLLGFYLGSGAAGSAYGAAGSLITLLLWVYYSSQILLFGAEFTQVYAARAGRAFKPSEYAVRVETREVETG